MKDRLLAGLRAHEGIGVLAPLSGMTNFAGRRNDPPDAQEKRMKALSFAWVMTLAVVGCTGTAGDEQRHPSGGSPTSGAGGAPSGLSSTSSSSSSTGTGGSGTGGSGSCYPMAPITRRLWRLSVEQFQNAVK